MAKKRKSFARLDFLLNYIDPFFIFSEVYNKQVGEAGFEPT